MFDVAELVGSILEEVIANVTSDISEQSNYYCNLLVGWQLNINTCSFIMSIHKGTLVLCHTRYAVFPDWRRKIWQADLGSVPTYDMPLDGSAVLDFICINLTFKKLDRSVCHLMCWSIKKYSLDDAKSKVLPKMMSISRQSAGNGQETLKKGLAELPVPSNEYFL